jgi:hypothetical protein
LVSQLFISGFRGNDDRLAAPRERSRAGLQAKWVSGSHSCCCADARAAFENTGSAKVPEKNGAQISNMGMWNMPFQKGNQLPQRWAQA